MRAAVLLFFAVAVVSALLLGVMIAVASLYVVHETEQVIITQFGKPVGQPITTPGLKFKNPLQQAHFIDKRLLKWDGAPNKMATKDRRIIVVVGWGQWRIADPMLFYQKVHNKRTAMARLDEIVAGEARMRIAEYDLIDVVRSTNRDFIVGPPAADGGRGITAGRKVLEREIIERASTRTRVFGIEVVDFRFRRTNYAEGERPRVYERMIEERRQMTEEIRSKGSAEAARIKASGS